MTGWAAAMGLRLPNGPDVVTVAVAAAIVALGWGLGYFAGRFVGPWIADLSERRAGVRADSITRRACALVRDLATALLLTIALTAYDWPPIAAFIVGLGLAIAVAAVVTGLVRGLGMSRWAAVSLATVAFLSVIAGALDGLGPVIRVLDQIGFTAGRTRVSLFSLLQVAVALLVLLAVVRLVNRVANHSIRHARGMDATQQLLAQKLVGIGLLVAAFFIGIDIIGIDLTALAIFSGAFGLAVGFGFQKTFGNLIAGVILLMDRSIKPGDVIAVGESFGSVNKIGVRAVSIVTREGKEHLIPNEILMTEEVVNWSYSTRDVRISVPVRVAYDCDLALAQRLMIEAARSSSRVLATPSPAVWLTEFGESAVAHEIRVWISDPEAGVASVRSDILNRLWLLFKENQITLPFPQRDIRVKEWPRQASAPPGPGD